MDTSCYIDLEGERLHYLFAGTGKKVLLTFHGYGLDGGTFQPVVEYLHAEYKILSFDLPHHGNSAWGAALFTKHLLVKLVLGVMEKYDVEKISLLGFSLGGRICMTIIELLPQTIDKVTLIAPDGLVFNMPYYLATSNFAGKKLFKNIVSNPKWFFRFTDWLLKRRMIDASRHKFVTQYLETDAARELLLRVWKGLTEIVPDLKKLRSVIKSHKIPVTIFMGSFDRIIPPVNAENFKKGLDTVQLHIFQKGHKVLDHSTAPIIAESLL